MIGLSRHFQIVQRLLIILAEAVNAKQIAFSYCGSDGRVSAARNLRKQIDLAWGFISFHL